MSGSLWSVTLYGVLDGAFKFAKVETPFGADDARRRAESSRKSEGYLAVRTESFDPAQHTWHDYEVPYLSG